jgi:dienelactone hydrolase
LEFVPQAREFARRGWTTVVVIRSGYGTSGGYYHEDGRACSRLPDYYGAGLESAKDLRAAISYVATLSQVDSSRMISVGVSAGGFATVALTADPPPGLVAAISFAGGRGSRAPDNVCNPEALVRAFEAFGRKSRIPMLWVYAQNDHFFGPQLAARFFQAFTASGGTATFIRADAFRTDGHNLFSTSGIPIWTPMVDEFLTARNLRLRGTLLALPAAPDVSAPIQLKAEGLREFRAFLTYPDYKAFAVSPSGYYGYVFGRQSTQEAQKLAQERCNNIAPKPERCSLMAIDDRSRGR